MGMNALKRLDCKQLVVFIGTLLLSLVSFFTLLPDSKALPDNNSNGKPNEPSVFPNTDAMAPVTPVNRNRALPKFLKDRPECTDSIPPINSQNHA